MPPLKPEYWKILRRKIEVALKTARELASWQPLKGSSDNDLLPELSTIVARSRDLARNHRVASGAIQTLTDNIVGVGFRLSAKFVEQPLMNFLLKILTNLCKIQILKEFCSILTAPVGKSMDVRSYRI